MKTSEMLLLRGGHGIASSMPRGILPLCQDKEIKRGREKATGSGGVKFGVKSPANREQLLLFYVERFRQEKQFFIGNAPQLRLNFRDGVFPNVPSRPCATRREHGLRPTFAVTNFSHDRPNNILRNGFAHNFSVDGMRDRSTIYSDFGRNACMGKMLGASIEGSGSEQMRAFPPKVRMFGGNFKVYERKG
jgi:hypothetical protein